MARMKTAKQIQEEEQMARDIFVARVASLKIECNGPEMTQSALLTSLETDYAREHQYAVLAARVWAEKQLAAREQ